MISCVCVSEKKADELSKKPYSEIFFYKNEYLEYSDSINNLRKINASDYAIFTVLTFIIQL